MELNDLKNPSQPKLFCDFIIVGRLLLVSVAEVYKGKPLVRHTTVGKMAGRRQALHHTHQDVMLLRCTSLPAVVLACSTQQLMSLSVTNFSLLPFDESLVYSFPTAIVFLQETR